MKISVVTPTYNRAKELDNLYKSLVENLKHNIPFEWVIMDDGSSDNTKQIIDEYINEDKIEIKYYFQENQGKMQALNNVMDFAEGDLIIECDSDDYFTDDAFGIVEKAYEDYNAEDIYAFVFLKYNQNLCNIGNNFEDDNHITTMFDLYYKEGETGDKALVFKSEIRKNYKHELERNEKFITEARMYNKIDLKYKIACFNKPLMICEYQEDGYSNNIMKMFKKYPYGYFEYFKELINLDMQGVKFKKRLYIVKHYILFSYLTKQKGVLRNIKKIGNKTLTAILLWPGYIKSYIKCK